MRLRTCNRRARRAPWRPKASPSLSVLYGDLIMGKAADMHANLVAELKRALLTPQFTKLKREAMAPWGLEGNPARISERIVELFREHLPVEEPSPFEVKADVDKERGVVNYTVVWKQPRWIDIRGLTVP